MVNVAPIHQEYSLSEGQDKVFRVRITRASDNLYTATVVDVGQSHDEEASGGRGVGLVGSRC